MACKAWPNELQQRFLDLWQKNLGPSTLGVEKVQRLLETAYAEPHRRYHSLDHIRFCLTQHDLAAPQMQAANEVELAIWFHDVVHQPDNKQNEADSAALFRQAAGSAAGPLPERVAGIILATTHDHVPSHQDACFMVDIDLASLARPWPAFAKDSRLLREEQADMPEADFYAVQRGFLQKLAERSFIYRTTFFRSRYEQRARANIARALNQQAA